MPQAALQIRIHGIVQGVGFRPFIYQLAESYGLKGYVSNTSHGVEIEVQGEKEALTKFLEDIPTKKPKLSQITDLQSQEIPLREYTDFRIRESQKTKGRSVLISPDMAVCEDCVRELFDRKDRRYRYPFINCTNCGPRYTIVSDLPYDRAFTSMASFPMCVDCQKEYEDPRNRRFHAQPNACPKCGPEVALYHKSGRKIETRDCLHEAALLLHSGKILAIKGLGGFHLAADACNKTAVRKLRARKKRPTKPFAVMAPNLKALAEYAFVDEEEKSLLLSPSAPIVLLRKKEPSPLAYEIAPGNRTLGVMLPYTPLHHLLLSEGFLALVMTSANQREEPIVLENQEAFERLEGLADFMLVHNRDIYCRADDSVATIMNRKPVLLRRSRGYAPAPILLKESFPPILACGAELKNTICLLRDNQAFVSQHIGDLENMEAFSFFEETIRHLKKILEVNPVALAYDLHPNYMASRYAKEQNLPGFAVQHHHAHILSAMAENHIEGDVLGVAFDGTGYGTDGRIWGGEILHVSTQGFTRLGHLPYIPMPGAEAAIRFPSRMALAFLYELLGEKDLQKEAAFFLERLPRAEIEIVLSLLRQKIYAPLTSSAGRLFDAVSSLLGICDRSDFEGEAAISLEMAAWQTWHEEFYPIEIRETTPFTFDLSPLFRLLLEDFREGKDKVWVSHKFHNAIVQALIQSLLLARLRLGHHRVVLSGGVFQNKLLMEKLTKELLDRGFEVYTHHTLPTNDGGLALGQAIAAAYEFRKSIQS